MVDQANLQPQPSAPHSLPGPEDILRAELSNGIVVLARANFNSPSVVVSGYLPAGGIFDPGEKLGLADFTASALMRGTARRNFQQVYNALESAGASLGVGGGTHNASFSGKALAEDLDLLLELLGDALRRPVFPPDQVERLRAQLLASLSIRAQDTADMASLAFDQLVYPNHPYSRPEDGYPETVQAISPADLVDFHRHHYGPRGLVIALVGALDPQQAVDKVAQSLGDWQNPDQPPSPVLPALPILEAPVLRKVTIAGKSQADLVMGAAGPARSSPDFLAASLGNSVLGQFGMMGRIGEVVREQAGLAYYAGSSLSGGLGPGPWCVTAGVDPQNIAEVIDLVSQEITRFTSDPVTQDELADSQANYVGRLPLSLESNGGVAAALINLERYNLGLDYYRRYSGLIYEITPEQCLEVARRYLDPTRLATAIAGS